MEAREIFSQRVKHVRSAMGLSQRDVAGALDMSQQGYQSYEIGRKTPSFDMLLRLADFFNVSLDYLVGRSDDPHLPRMDEETKNLFLALRALKGNTGTAQ